MLDAAAIRVTDDIQSKEALQCREVALLGREEEGFQKASMFARAHRPTALARDVLAGAADELSSVCFAELKDGRDLLIGVVERFAENEGSSFRWRQLLRQQQDREL